MRLTLLAFAATAVATSNAAAQFPPIKLTNLKYFSKKLPVRSLTDSMRYFTRALGVRCQSCHAADALRLYLLNTALLPTSGYAHRQAAGGYLAAGDTTSAIAMFEKALAINPNDRQAQQALTALRAKH